MAVGAADVARLAQTEEPLESEGGKARRSRVSGIDRALQIFDYLQDTGKPATGYDIARAVGAPLSTVYAIIDDLLDKRMLARDGESGVWLGPRLFHYGLAYARALDLLTIAEREMHDLCRSVGETVQICGRDGDDMVVLAMAEGPSHFQVTSRVGTRVPLNWTASGRLLVGHLPEGERQAVFARCAVPSPTGRAETDAAALSAAAAKATDARLSIQAGESDYSVACVAAPIRDRSGACVATISVVLPDFKVAQDPERYADAVRDAASRVEDSLGRRGR